MVIEPRCCYYIASLEDEWMKEAGGVNKPNACWFRAWSVEARRWIFFCWKKKQTKNKMYNGEGVGGEANIWFAAYSSTAFSLLTMTPYWGYCTRQQEQIKCRSCYKNSTRDTARYSGVWLFNLKASFDESELNRPVDCEIQSLLLYSAFTSWNQTNLLSHHEYTPLRPDFAWQSQPSIIPWSEQKHSRW